MLVRKIKSENVNKQVNMQFIKYTEVAKQITYFNNTFINEIINKLFILYSNSKSNALNSRII